MTHEERVYHHMYETLEGIAEQSERIAKLEELCLDMREGMCGYFHNCVLCDHYEGGGMCEFDRRLVEMGVVR